VIWDILAKPIMGNFIAKSLDPNLAKAIRAELKKSPTGEELKPEELLKLNSLYPRNTDDKITSLEGLEKAVNMQSLF
jgi:hypothetical protein